VQRVRNEWAREKSAEFVCLGMAGSERDLEQMRMMADMSCTKLEDMYERAAAKIYP
jgi:hypothetical protein